MEACLNHVHVPLLPQISPGELLKSLDGVTARHRRNRDHVPSRGMRRVVGYVS
jgi:hypothetical protein